MTIEIHEKNGILWRRVIAAKFGIHVTGIWKKICRGRNKF